MSYIYLVPHTDLAQSMVSIQSYGRNTDPIVHIVSAMKAGRLNPTEKRSRACIVLLSEPVLRAMCKSSKCHKGSTPDSGQDPPIRHD